MKFLIRQGGLWLLLLSCWLPSASAQLSGGRVSAVVITNIGPAAASEDLIRANIHIKVGDVFVVASIDDDVKNLYGTGFFRIFASFPRLRLAVSWSPTCCREN